MSRTIELHVGDRFGKLVVVGPGPSIRGSAQYECMCDCGRTTIVRSLLLRKGRTRSCGCLIGKTSNEGQFKATHGMSLSLTYKSWIKMKERCMNKKHIKWNLYGGRGIKICDRLMTTGG